MAKDSKKSKEPKLARREVNNCSISSHEVLGAFARTVELPSLNLSGEELLSEIISKMQPAVELRDVLGQHFDKLTSNLSEFRTRHAVQRLEIAISHEVEYDDQSLKFRLYAYTDAKAVPDRPAMTGQQARGILENCFEDFHIDVYMPEDGNPTYQQKTILSYDLKNGDVHDVPWSLCSEDPRNLYINIVHNICGIIQKHGEENVARIYSNMEYAPKKSVTVEEFKAHVKFRNGPEEPVVKKKKVTRKKK